MYLGYAFAWISDKRFRTKDFGQKISDKRFRTKDFGQNISAKIFRTKYFGQNISDKIFRTKVAESPHRRQMAFKHSFWDLWIGGISWDEEKVRPHCFSNSTTKKKTNSCSSCCCCCCPVDMSGEKSNCWEINTGVKCAVRANCTQVFVRRKTVSKYFLTVFKLLGWATAILKLW
jgi:hypothetical protein